MKMSEAGGPFQAGNGLLTEALMEVQDPGAAGLISAAQVLGVWA